MQWPPRQVVCSVHTPAFVYRVVPADATATQPSLNPDWFCLSATGLPRLHWKRGHTNGCGSKTLRTFHFSNMELVVLAWSLGGDDASGSHDGVLKLTGSVASPRKLLSSRQRTLYQHISSCSPADELVSSTPCFRKLLSTVIISVILRRLSAIAFNGAIVQNCKYKEWHLKCGINFFKVKNWLVKLQGKSKKVTPKAINNILAYAMPFWAKFCPQ